MKKDWLKTGGVIFLKLIIILLILTPTIVTIIIGVWLAGQLGVTGIVWWAFVILFWLIISVLLSVLTVNKWGGG